MPARLSIGISLAPSPTATTCSREMPSCVGDFASRVGLAISVDDGRDDAAGDDAVDISSSLEWT